jgi:hypothetical protein
VDMPPESTAMTDGPSPSADPSRGRAEPTAAEDSTTPDILSPAIMTPEESAAYLASHPAFARRVEATARQLAERYGHLLAEDTLDPTDGGPPTG